MTFGNIYFKQNAKSQTYIDVSVLFHPYCAFLHLLKRLSKSATAPSSPAKPTAVCPQQALHSVIIHCINRIIAPVRVDKEQRTNPSGENKNGKVCSLNHLTTGFKLNIT